MNYRLWFYVTVIASFILCGFLIGVTLHAQRVSDHAQQVTDELEGVTAELEQVTNELNEGKEKAVFFLGNIVDTSLDQAESAYEELEYSEVRRFERWSDYTKGKYYVLNNAINIVRANGICTSIAGIMVAFDEQFPNELVEGAEACRKGTDSMVESAERRYPNTLNFSD